MSMFEHPDYRAGLNNQRSTSTNIHSPEYQKGVADRQFRESHPLFGNAQGSSQPLPAPRGVASSYGAGSGSGSKSGGGLKALGVLLLLVAGYALIHSASDKKQANTRAAEAPAADSRSAEAPSTEAPSTGVPTSVASAAESPSSEAPVAQDSTGSRGSWGTTVVGGECVNFLRMVESGSKPNTGSVPPLAGIVSLCTTAAQDGDPQAMVSLGSMYEQGLGVPQDAQQAISWYKAAAQSSDSEAAAEAQKDLQRLGAQ